MERRRPAKERRRAGKTIDEIAHSRTVKKWISDRPKKASRNVALKPVKLPIISDTELATAGRCAVRRQRTGSSRSNGTAFAHLATIDADGTVELTSRNGKDLLERNSRSWPISDARFVRCRSSSTARSSRSTSKGRSSFQRLQNRIESIRGPRRTPSGGDIDVRRLRPALCRRARRARAAARRAQEDYSKA